MIDQPNLNRVISDRLSKVSASHLKRDAYLYVRQSTLHQVLENTESTQRQYALRERAVALGWPDDRKLVVKSLAKGSPLAANEISEVRLLGHNGKLEWSRAAEGLIVNLPEKKPCDHAFAIKITMAP